ncbi:MAG: PilZ domain-containing protein [Candidatus Acidiferrales bacterium]
MSARSLTERKSQPATRRSVLRCSLVASADVIELGSGSSAKLSARISELGLGGCYVDTLNPFPEGTLVHLRILRDGGVFETKARVAYSDGRFGMGLAFTEMTPNQRSILENWLTELVTQLRPTS